jgi:acyl-CoA thioester hydrolase
MTRQKKHQSDFTVRGYELDSYGHLNNAVYLQYLEQARWEYTRDTGILRDITVGHLLLVVIETHIRYIRELRLFDRVTVETSCQVHEPFLEFRQRIMEKESGKPVARATVKTLFVDRDRTPRDIPGNIIRIINQEAR